MSGTQEWRPCHICGEKVLWQTNGIGWHPIQYHDCKPVPLARLQQAERERDEARADHRRSMHAAIEQRERLAQATALLREWREDDGLPAATHTSKRGRTDAFLAGQPAHRQTKE